MDYLKQKLPNLLTVLRMIVVPMMIMAFCIDTVVSRYLSLTILIAACLTDFLDGYLARTWHAQSTFGKLLDPVADKLIVVSTIIMLIYTRKIDQFTIVPAIVIVLREILISGFREFLISSRVTLPVDRIGRIKTTLQMISLIILMLDYSIILKYIGDVLFWAASILTVWSGYNHVRIGMKHIC